MTDSLIAVIGADSTIVHDAVFRELNELLGGLDAALALEDISATATNDDGPSAIRRALDALNTPPFLTDRRVVVVRDAVALSAEDAEQLVAWAAHPTPGVTCVVAIEGGRGAAALRTGAHRIVDVSVGNKAKERAAFVAAAFERNGVRAGGPVHEAIAAQLGEDMARVDSLARTLAAIFGTAVVKVEDVEPYLGDAGNVPEWDLTDAIESGAVADAVATVQRMLETRARNGLQIVNILQRHYLRMARLEGSGAQTGADAAKLIGGHAYPAQKLLHAARVLGPERIARAVGLVTQADADLKGGVDYGGRTEDAIDQTDLVVTEVLVARLARLSEAARRS